MIRLPADIHLHHSRELDVQVRREPVARLQRVQQLRVGRRAERAAVDLLLQVVVEVEVEVAVVNVGREGRASSHLQVALFAHELRDITVPCDVLWPVVREKDVDGLLEVQQPQHL